MKKIIGRAETPEEKRIVLERFYTLWMRYPQLRFGQLIKNAFLEDIYYVEDEPFIEGLERFYYQRRNYREHFIQPD